MDCPADCTEIRVSLADSEQAAYAVAEFDDKYRLAAHAPRKDPGRAPPAEEARGEQTLVIGQYLDQLDYLARDPGGPTGHRQDPGERT